MKIFLFLVAAVCLICRTLPAQTTLSGDHVITGNLGVGTSGSNKSLVVTGRVGIGGPISAVPLTVSGTDDAVLSLISLSGTATLFVSDISNIGTNAPLGSIAFTGESAKIKYGQGHGDWGRILFHSSDNSVELAGGIALGDDCVAMAHGTAYSLSVAMSGGYADFLGEYSTAMSGGQTYDPYSTAMSGAMTDAAWSTALSNAYSGGQGSVAMAKGMTWENAVDSVAMSEGSVLAVGAVAAGKDATAVAYHSFVIGRNNEISGAESLDQWIETDPLFVVGNGTGAPSDSPAVKNRDAFTVYKSGKIKMQRQGDILMGQFGNPE